MHFTVICARNSFLPLLARVFAGLLLQDLARENWELVLVDTALLPPISQPD